VSALVFFNVQKWNDLAGNDKAWDALIWLGGLITIAKLLTTYGFIEWFVMNIKGWVEGYNGFLVLIILLLVYFYSMYMFSSLSAHLTALAPTFLALTAVSFGYPLVAAALFAYFSLLCGCLTPYSTGPFIIYFGYGYVQSSKWFSTGLILSLFHLIVWFGVGMMWWKILHWW
jgi:DASS family divalent anion:Na+ symporter